MNIDSRKKTKQKKNPSAIFSMQAVSSPTVRLYSRNVKFAGPSTC